MAHVWFIIPAHNEEAHLPSTLAAIRKVIEELRLDAQVVVADDGSTDRTGELAREAGAIVVRHERRQIAATRNLGARAARDGVLFFVDADTRVNTEVVRQSLDLLASGCIGGGAMPFFDGTIPWHARVMTVVFIRLLRWRNKCGGAFLFCTREAFDRSGGFREDVYAAEEMFFVQALKRVGRFRLARARCVTSGRKLRTYSAREIYGFFVRGVLSGGAIVRTREKLGLWYGPRREDPEPPPR